MEKNLKKGQWLFTCAMKPKQFSHYNERDRVDYSEVENEEEFLEWLKYNDFVTLEGSSHSQKNCSCKPISEKYAKWFLENKVYELYEDDFGIYEEQVKELCKKHNIEYEGI